MNPAVALHPPFAEMLTAKIELQLGERNDETARQARHRARQALRQLLALLLLAERLDESGWKG